MGDSKLKILIVDDERANLEILTHILKPGSTYKDDAPIHPDYSLIVVKSGQAAIAKAKSDNPDLILMDIIMPGISGFEALAELKRCDETRSIPVIFITGLDNIEDEEKGFHLGAVDYITKPFHNSLVRARVRTHLQIVEQMRMIERLGMIDILTNIPNRRGFENQMTVEWGRAIRTGTCISLLMLDIDNFKSFNDKYGHRQGDAVLKTVAGILLSSLRRSADLAARWGGEEFAVILPDTDLAGASNVAGNIRAGIENTSIPAIRDFLPLSVTVSIGVASESPAIDSSMQDFIDRADKALYDAKESGRNKICS